jgi:hypothetical protein
VRCTEVLLYVWGAIESGRSVAAHHGKTRHFVLLPCSRRHVRVSHAMMVTEISSPLIQVVLEHMVMQCDTTGHHFLQSKVCSPISSLAPGMSLFHRKISMLEQ